MSIKKMVSTFLSALVLLNIAMPIFAYASVDSNMTSNDNFEVSVSNDTDADELMNIDLENEKISLSLDKKRLISGNLNLNKNPNPRNYPKDKLSKLRIYFPKYLSDIKSKNMG